MAPRVVSGSSGGLSVQAGCPSSETSASEKDGEDPDSAAPGWAAWRAVAVLEAQPAVIEQIPRTARLTVPRKTAAFPIPGRVFRQNRFISGLIGRVRRRFWGSHSREHDVPQVPAQGGPRGWNGPSWVRGRTWIAGILGFVPLLLAARAVASAHPNGVPNGATEAARASWKVGVQAAIKEAFDSNVHLQSETDPANRSSFVSTLMAGVSGAWNPGRATFRLDYQPEVNWFHAEPSEDFVVHRGNARFGWKGLSTVLDAGASMVGVDGASTGPTYCGPGGAPATGGVPVRDRRDAVVYRGQAQVAQSMGRWFVRPSVTVYEHDFRTVQKADPGYLNYVDRNEFTVGADLGLGEDDARRVWLGHRYGRQDQSPLLAFPEEYDSRFHRVLAGVQATLVEWCNVSLLVGPEFRTYETTVPTGFGSLSKLNLFLDTTLTFRAGKADTVTLAARRFEQPGFAGRAAYEDMTLDVSWRHKLGKAWTLGVGGRAYGTDFLEPVQRDDWVLSVNTLVHWVATPEFAAEASYAYEAGETRTPGATGREYGRHLLAVGVRYTLR